MKERPILFSGEMVRAILAGRKTQTRRVLRYQPLDILPMKIPDAWVTLDTREPEAHGKMIRCRHGVPGDRLWVRETFRIGDMDSIFYRADEDWNNEDVWRPSIFMPRWASRITLEVTRVRVEHLNDISEADVYAEGMTRPTFAIDTCFDEYRELWDKINGQRAPWDSNPWVWVVEFKRVPPPA